MTARSHSIKELSAASEDALLDFTPSTYWPKTKSKAGPKNELLRRIDHALTNGDWSAVRRPDVAFGARGGDFLTDTRALEVEIARLALESTTWDVISIRARPTSRGIAYRVVDEYESAYSIRPKTSRKPLRFGQLIRLIDEMTNGERPSSPAALRGFQSTFDDPAHIRKLRSFVTVASVFYPDLEAWYRREAEQWVNAELEALPARVGAKEQAEAAEVLRLKSAAAADDPDALAALGYRSFVGRGVPRDREQAVGAWQRASALGDLRSTFNLAVCLQDGYGIPKDEASALALYERLGRDRYFLGMKMAGYCRHVGIGCEPDRLLALGWYFEIFKATGSNRYNDELVNCLRAGSGESEVERSVVAWVQDSASRNQAAANMLRDLSTGTAREPVKHDAGIGYLGDGPLIRFDA